MAIGETPSEPLIALMNHALDGGTALSHKKEIAKIAGICQNRKPKGKPLSMTQFSYQWHQ